MLWSKQGLALPLLLATSTFLLADIHHKWPHTKGMKMKCNKCNFGPPSCSSSGLPLLCGNQAAGQALALCVLSDSPVCPHSHKTEREISQCERTLAPKEQFGTCVLTATSWFHCVNKKWSLPSTFVALAFICHHCSLLSIFLPFRV